MPWEPLAIPDVLERTRVTAADVDPTAIAENNNWKENSKNNWKQTSCDTRDQLQMPWDLHPWVDVATLAGVPRQLRSRDSIELAWWSWYTGKSTTAAEKKRYTQGCFPEWFVDITQNAGGTSSRDVPCLLQGSQVYSFELDKMLSTEETCAK